MAGFTKPMQSIILDRVFASAGFTDSPASFDVALYTVAPNEDGTGGTEVSGTGYVVVNVVAADFGAATDEAGGASSKIANTSVVTFPQAGAAWGTVTHWGLKDNASGLLRIWDALDASKVVDSGDTPSFAAGDLAVHLGDPSDTYT